MTENLMYGALAFIVLLVLVLPLTSRKVEHNLEIFLFVMGVLSITVSQVFSTGFIIEATGGSLPTPLTSPVITKELIIKALEEPIMITGAVLLFGILFKVFKDKINSVFNIIQRHVPMRLLFFLVVVILGLVSSIITAIIAALFLVEIINCLKLDRKSEIGLTIVACFAIGMGAALTPIGEPLSTIVVAKLNEDFWYLLRNFGIYIIPSVIAFGIIAAFAFKPVPSSTGLSERDEGESYKEVVFRALKVYLFVMALTFLGTGLKPLIDRFILGLSTHILYWINMLSAILDNATLAAAEISDLMSLEQITAILIGLLISGGMLIPGNIPNIISASKLKIGSKEWAKLGVPMGLATMLIFFVILFAF